MSMSRKEKMIAESLSKAFEKLSVGDLGAARQQTFLIHHNLKADIEDIRSILRRIRLE